MRVMVERTRVFEVAPAFLDTPFWMTSRFFARRVQFCLCVGRSVFELPGDGLGDQTLGAQGLVPVSARVARMLRFGGREAFLSVPNAVQSTAR
jgi:hypothetical protein